VTELERSLRRLGEQLAFPETPAVADAVLRRLEAEGAPRRRARRRPLVVALAVLALALAAAMAVPAARTAILELFRLRGATVERVDTLPPVAELDPATARALELGRPVPIEGGRPAVEAGVVLVPAALGAPDAAYVSRAVPGKLTLVYEPRPGIPRSGFTGVGVLVTQFAGDLDRETYLEKLADAGTLIEPVTVGGSPGLWLEGGPHFVFFTTPEGGHGEDWARLAGNTLLLQRGDVLVRIEGRIGRERALAIAESLEPR
jgi:hypothetical protein